MALTTAQQVRLRISDRWRWAEEYRGGDGTALKVEIGQFTAVGGTIPGAALEAVRTLMFDSLRRAKWAAPDGTEYDDTAALAQLRAMHDLLLEETTRDDGGQGGIESWAEQQQNWSSEYS